MYHDLGYSDWPLFTGVSDIKRRDGHTAIDYMRFIYPYVPKAMGVDFLFHNMDEWAVFTD